MSAGIAGGYCRRAEALGSHYEARLRGLSQATQVAFVPQAEGFSPAVPGGAGGLNQATQVAFVPEAEGFSPAAGIAGELNQATQVAFVLEAEGFSPAVPDGAGILATRGACIP